ncbi:thiol:disulfide interchange protein DsbA/DsbL [Shewanella sp. SR44-4]|jgi:protein-disulfide isomerase|uniref:thiol:disulfide interchange protein DsbA/DsbL n=1 Tax=Shewanella sp. SR44-4 TaxID=2760935 RepID=UPI0015FF98A2|nr:thiol:disulfide interchange protein DsbA/DsbL [Shewanella sp. SR44-4]MBB1363536.1 thiol:disulfide interchange protein DsbA/DsbL [Shewanella sp. SR44-4]
MIKYFAIVLTLITASFSTFATPFVEGKHYTQISNNMVPSEPKVTEFFSFYCHNCFNMESQYLPEIKAGLDKKIAFDSKHVDFMNSDLGTEVMRALAVIHELDNKEALKIAMFGAIQGKDNTGGHDHAAAGHEHQSQINNRDDIKNVFAQFGVDAEQYDTVANSADTNKKLTMWRQQQVSYAVQSVPAFIVNDKYAINLNEMRSLDDIIGVINYLALKQ